MEISVISLYDVMRRNDGGSVRTYNLAKGLASYDHRTTIMIPGRIEDSTQDGAVQIKLIKGLAPYRLLAFISLVVGVKNPELMYIFDPIFLRRLLNETLRSDAIQVDAPPPAASIVAFVLGKMFGKLVVVDSHDAFQALRIQYSSVLRRVLELCAERIAYWSANIVLTVSERDRELLVRYGVKRNKIIVIPNGVNMDVKPAIEKRDSRKKLLGLGASFVVIFVGNMEYPPNEEAASLISKEIAPQVWRQIRNVRFVLVGKKPRSLHANAKLLFTGAVPDVTLYLSASDVAIAPLMHGSGTRLKVLEYMARGIPTISTSIGIEGLRVQNDVTAVVEDDIQAFSAQIVQLLRDPERRKRLSDAGRELVEKEYDWKMIVERLNKAYELLIAGNWEIDKLTRANSSPTRLTI